MTRTKHLWQRLLRLEDEYHDLTGPHEEPCSPVGLRGFPTAAGPHASPERLRQLEQEISALRVRFGVGADDELAMDLSARPRVFLHTLPPGRQHPVTPQEVLDTVASLPAADRAGLLSISLCDARKDRYASYNGGHIKLFYPTDPLLRVRLRRNEGYWEVRQFGAWVEEEEGERYVCWERADLCNYVLRHLLLHEIGHHVAYLRGFAYAVVATRREEQFAESYAQAAFDPCRS